MNFRFFFLSMTLSLTTVMVQPAGAQSKAPALSSWLNGKLYGSDNGVAKLKAVRISERDGRYKVLIENQFRFECDLTFSDSGTPHSLSHCLSRIGPSDPGYEEEASWRVQEENIPLQCQEKGSDVLCQGRYSLFHGDMNISGATKDVMTIGLHRKK